MLARTRAVLTTDLDCTGQQAGVILRTGSRLDLGGFTLSGAVIGVRCDGRCTVTGPGTISGSKFGVNGVTSVTMRDVGLADFTESAVRAGGALSASSVTITGAALYGLAGLNVKADDSSVSSSFGGVTARNARLRGITITGCTRGFTGTYVALLDGSTIDTVAAGPAARAIRSWKRPRIVDSTCLGRSEGIRTEEPWGVCSMD